MTDGGRRARSGNDDWDVFNHPPPIPVPDGIRARSRRGAIGETWWSKRFVAALDTYYTTTAARLSRGRSYARAGQVVRMDLLPGRVSAVVQGSRAKPYDVDIRVRRLTVAEWRRVEAAMAARAVFLARLLSGEMPNEIEEAFDAAGVRLFPSRKGDLRTSCSCPDTANPCKHIAAVYYLLAESFDGDPFLIFAWRGRSRGQLTAELRALRPPSGAKGSGVRARRSVAPRGGPAGAATKAGALDLFWNGRTEWTDVRIDRHPAGSPDALLREMPPDVADAFGPEAAPVFRSLYVAAARAARQLLEPGAVETGSARRRRGGRRARRG